MTWMDNPDPVSDAAAPGQTHPWRRFFARSLDGALATIGFGVLIVLLAPSWLDQPDLIFAAPIYLGWAALEASMLSVVGATPARWLFGIRVLAAETGRPLPIARSLKRVVIVWVAGLGLTIPLVALVTQAMAYHRLTTTGTTIWDRSSEAIVTHTEWSAARAFVCTACIALVLGIIIVAAINPFE